MHDWQSSKRRANSNGWESRNAEVTEPGLEHLGGFSQLQDLDLASTRVGDAGLKHLKGLSQLQSLWLCGTHVTDAGLNISRG